MFIAVAGISIVLVGLLRPVGGPSHGKAEVPPAAAPLEPTRVGDATHIVIAPEAAIWKQLQIATAEEKQIAFPTLTVSGVVLARVRPGTGPLEDRWQFNTSDLATIYADWTRSKSEVDYARRQLDKTKELTVAETNYLESNVNRLKPLTESSSVAIKEFKLAQAELLKAQIQGQKNIFEAESSLRVFTKSKIALERQLSQAGIDPAVFSKSVENMVLVTANVPELHLSQVRLGLSCDVRFYGLSDRVFPAHVEAMNSALSADRRTLPVLFELNDTEGLLRPGMFSEIGLGTENRKAILVPSESLLHVGLKDFVLVGEKDKRWRVQQVQVGEPHQGVFEIPEGVKRGDKVLNKGMILLKPLVQKALDTAQESATR